MILDGVPSFGASSPCGRLLPRATCPTAALDAAMRTGATLRARELQSHQRAHDEACERLAAALAEADVDGVVSERVLAERYFNGASDVLSS